MKKRILSILLTLCMLLCIMPTAAFAEGSPDITGAGTAADPYLIYTAAGLKEFRRRVNAAESGAHANLMNNIVLNDGTFDEDGNYTKGESGKDAETWEPINNYHGTFDGNGHTVKGLYVNGGKYAGLFGQIPYSYATVENVAVTGYVSGKNAGGIAGEMLSGSISNCLNHCTVTGSERAGGIAGTSRATIINCGNSGSVSGSVFVGGIAGVSNLAINYCFNTGSVSGSGEQSWVGGIAGSSTTSSRITNCYNTGSVSGFGENHSIGGIAGDSGYNTITNCYNVGQISSADETDCIGGIVGRQTKGTVNNCYYPTGVADKGIGYTEYSPTVTNTEAKSKAEFADGTVLKLLKQNDTINAWQRECGYLNAAGMTLPLLSWQTADAHTHNKNGNLGGCDCGQLPAGTADDPYLIYTAEDLKQFRDTVNGGNTGICAKLMNDIVLNDGAFDENGNWSEDGTPDRWTPIGNAGLSSAYCGTFDGNGHTIKGLYINSDEECKVGLFGYTVYPAVIHNLTVDGYVKGKDAVSSIVGYAYNTSISNCYNTGTISGNNYVGGIVGYAYNTNISSCYNIGTVNGNNYVGGIAGATSYANISNCYYLTGTAENGGGGEAKSEEEFADGTVLNLLKNGDENSPWEKCGYLNAAGMIVPLLNGQTSDTFPIYTAEDLKTFRNAVNGGNTGICAKLMNDIVLNDGTFDENGNYTKGTSGKDADMWMPINGYGGTFDGDGHTIQGVYVNYGGDAGLFSSASGATIKGLTITGYIKGKDRVGGIVGYMSSGTITGCRNAAVVRGEQSSYIACGGIAGRLTTGTIANCENVGSVQATPSGDGLEVGGIVGHAGSYDTSAIFEACANLGSVTAIVDDAGGYARVGGITGFVAQHVDLIDCYNAGSLLLTEQKGTPDDSCLGGIFGCKFDGVYSSESELPSASNCYNVGTMTHTGNGKVAIGDIGGETPNIKIINCYGLTGKTKAEFADGTVLALLKGDRTDSPWAKTDYLKAAGMTLPLLDWQTADAHTHDYQWKYDDTEHWKECSCGFIEQGSKAAHKEVTGICTDGIQCACGYEMHTATGGHSYPADWTAVRPGSTHEKACTNPGCGVTKTESCTGGTATCTEQATCEVCGEKYGTTDLNNHSYEWQNENGRYWQKCKLCDFETDKKLVPTIIITGSDKVCRSQDYTFSFTLPEGATDAEWGYEFINLAGGPITPTLENGRYYGVMDSDYYSKSENSFRLIVSGVTADGFEFRTEKTVAVLDAHTGGTATCTEQATCEVCHEKYGEKDPNNHTDTTEWIQTATTHMQKNKCCGAIVVAEENHEWASGVCSECHYACGHSGGTATCTDKAVCEICGEKYGNTNPDNHTDTTEWAQTETKHTQKYKCCGAVTVAEENHEWKDGTCTKCGYGCRHTYERQSENGEYWQKCKFCNYETVKKDIPTVNISGADKVCRTQDYKFSFALPEGATDAAYGYEFIGLGDGPLTPTVENNLYSGSIKASVYPAEESGFKLIVSAQTADGFVLSAEKTVTIQNEHTGGTATCTEQATCEICGEKYGDLKPHSYSPDWRADETNHWHECSECGAKADESEHTDTDKNHKCDVCEKVLSKCTDTNNDHRCDLCGKTLSEHTGGTATCKDKAVCEICGESYGELDSNNHADMKHIEAIAATKTAEGNIEYWYCDGCGKYFADKDGNKEITKADTVATKLPDEKPTSPKTGDTSNLALWIALLFISGGVITVTTVVSKKKRHS